MARHRYVNVRARLRRARASIIATVAVMALLVPGLALAVSTGGSGGPQSDRTFQSYTDSQGITSRYHLFAAGLDWTKEVGFMIYTDGSGGYGFDNPASTYLLDSDGSAGLVAVAKKHNMILLVPEAPAPGCDGYDNCWYNATGSPTPVAKAQWARNLVNSVYAQYPVEKDRVAIGGYSSGAQFTSRWFVPAHGAAIQTDGVFVPIAYGGAPAVAGNFPQSYKDAVVGSWDTGTADSAYSSASYGAVGGYNWYTQNGFTTEANWPAGVGHARDGEFDAIMDREITQHVRTARTLGTTSPTPTPTPTPVPAGYATTVDPTANGVIFNIADVPSGAPSTYVRVTRVSDGDEKYLYTSATGDVSVTFTTLGTAGDAFTYRVFAGSSTTTTPKAEGSFRTWEPAPVPGDRNGDRVVNFADVQDLSADRPDDAELAEIVKNWTN